MAEFGDALRAMWAARAASAGGWFAPQYEDAVARIKDETGDAENPYWLSPSDGTSAIPGEGEIYNEYGGEEPIEEARRRAFEVLVLADLAEAARKGGSGA